jgi:hypothetical protein
MGVRVSVRANFELSRREDLGRSNSEKYGRFRLWKILGFEYLQNPRSPSTVEPLWLFVLAVAVR